MPKQLPAAVLLLLTLRGLPQARPDGQGDTALVGGLWFNGTSFDRRTVYSVRGKFSFSKPPRVDRTLDLRGTWVVPPFGEAHNHNLGTGVESRDETAVKKYLTDGVFYVKIQGNLPLTLDRKQSLGLNRPESIDVAFGQGSITAPGGHPITLVESLLRAGFYPGYSRETLQDNRYFAIGSPADLQRKWPLVLLQQPDFIKTFLWSSDEFDRRKDDPEFRGRRGLSPEILTKIVARAHADGLRVSTHVSNAADFHEALAAGVDEITHIPFVEPAVLDMEDVKAAAARHVTVITTSAALRTLPRLIVPNLSEASKTQAVNLRLLRDHGVQLAIGSDNVADSSAGESLFLSSLGIFSNLAILKMWSETTPRAIFPMRSIGALRDGFEASFIALEGNPLDDLKNVGRIRLRFKQGVLLPNLNR